MNEQYINLFKEIARTSEVLAEQVMEYDHNNGDKQGENAAKIMHDDFAKLYDQINSNQLFTRSDFIKLLVGAMVVNNNIKDQVAQKQKAIDGYEKDLIPKLNQIMNNTKTDEEAIKLAQEIFN